MTARLPQNKNLTFHSQATYQDLPVLEQRGGLIENYLRSIDIAIRRSLAEYPRTYAIRVDLRLPPSKEPISSRVISKFIDSLKAQIRADLDGRRRRGVRVHPCRLRYIWVKERSEALQHHYHVLLLLNNDTYRRLGDFSAADGNMAARIKKAWASALMLPLQSLGGLVHFPSNAEYRVNASSLGFDDEYKELFRRASYFAKAATKQYGGGSNSFGCSRL